MESTLAEKSFFVGLIEMGSLASITKGFKNHG